MLDFNRRKANEYFQYNGNSEYRENKIVFI